MAHQLVQAVSGGLVLRRPSIPLPGPTVVEDLGHHPPEVVEVQGLHEEVPGSFPHARHDGGHVVVGGHEDHIHPRCPFAKEAKQLQAVQAGHADVGKDEEVRGCGPDQRQRLLAVLGGGDLGTYRRKAAG